MKVCFKVKDREGLFEDYSNKFNSVEDALVWYHKRGYIMEELYGRKLYLVQNRNHLVDSYIINKTEEKLECLGLKLRSKK